MQIFILWLIFISSLGFECIHAYNSHHTVNISNISQKLTITANNNSYKGYDLMKVGDVNGDGYADFFIYKSKLEFYLIFGGNNLQDINFQNLSTNQGVIIYGLPMYSHKGEILIFPAGDINGDGCDDFLLSNPYVSGYDYSLFFSIMFGKTGSWNDIYLNQTFFASTAIHISYNSLEIGYGIIPVGDPNCDGFADFIVEYGEGGAYLIFGKRDWSDIFLSNLTVSEGIAIWGADSYEAGSAGDINGDGCSDFVIGSNNQYTNGRTYIFFGTEIWETIYLENVTQYEWVTDFLLYATCSSSPMGDVNGDGYDDFMLCGQYLIYGKKHWDWTDVNYNFAYLNQTDIDCQNFFELDDCGVIEDATGDINGDGYTDFLVSGYDKEDGAPRNYLILGGPLPDWYSNDIYLGYFRIERVDLDGDVSSIVAADINEDGSDDFVFMYQSGYPGANGIGHGYIVFGGDVFNYPTTTTSTTTIKPSTPSPTITPSKSSSSNSTWIKYLYFGGGGVVGVCLIVVIFWFLYRRCRHKPAGNFILINE